LVFNTIRGRKCNNMRKLFILLFLLPFSLFGQTTYQLNYDSIRVNKTTGTGGTSLYGKVYLKNVTTGLTSDSILSVRNGRILKVSAPSATGGTGGGASVSYYLNGSVNQGTFVGNVYREMNKTPILGAGTNFTIATNGYITQFITDANDPGSLLIPAGNWNFETYFSANSNAGSPSFYVELYKYNGSTFTLIASNSATPELISFGTAIHPYFSALAVPETVLSATDRLAVRIYVNNSGRTITLHTEGVHLCQIVTTFTTGLQSLNGLTKQIQSFATGTSGSDFNISSVTDLHTFNIPSASASNRGLVTTGTQTFAGDKTFANIAVGGLTASSVASTASTGVSGVFTNNATSFETIRATNSGSGLIASFRNSGGEVASILNSGGATFTNQLTVSTTSLPSAIGASSTNANGRVITALGNSTLEPLSVTQQGSGHIATFNNSATPYAIIRNNGSIYTRGQLEVGNLLVGDAADSVMVHRAIDLTVRRVPTTGTGSAVFSASPTFTGTIIGASSNFSGSMGIGITPTFPLHVSKSVASNYVASLNNTNNTAGQSFGLFINAGTNSSDRAINVNNAANTITLLASFGNGDFEIGGSNATKASGTAWINPSDSRLKENIQPYSKGLNELLLINPKVWNYNKASGVSDTTTKHVSPIAQELAEVMPEMVLQYVGKLNGKDTNLLSIDGSDYTMLLINAVKEQQTIIQELKARITALEAQTQPNN